MATIKKKVRNLLVNNGIFNYFLYFILTFILVTFFFNFNYCNSGSSSDLILGNQIIDKEKISVGYTLLTPFDSYGNPYGEGTIYLVDLFGKPVHTWKTMYKPFYAVLKSNGNIVTAFIDPVNKNTAGNTGIILELDWDGNILWEYKNKNLKLDFDIMPNGNIAALVTEKVPGKIAEKVKGGYPDSKAFIGGMVSDAIIEINKSGDIVWVWHAYEHLDPEKYVLGPLSSRSVWTHANSLKYIKEDPFDREEAFLVSFRNVNTVVIVKKNDGSIVWNSKKSMLSSQHDATLLPNGNILVFDNNRFREPLLSDFRVQFGSRVIEINPKSNQSVWEFNGGESGIERARFTAELTSGAQRLKNGNTLIVHGPLGYLFEVTPEGRIVWELTSPFSAYTTGAWPNNALFKARRYSEDEVKWPKKIDPEFPKSALLCQKIKRLLG